MFSHCIQYGIHTIHLLIMTHWLVVGIPTPLKNDGLRQLEFGMMKFPIYGKQKCSKPPTSV